MCAKEFTYGEIGEPLCTGPSESRDEHEPTLMRLVRIGRGLVHPVVAERRANGPLIITDVSCR